MKALRRAACVLVGLAAFSLCVCGARAEDFSVHLDRLTEVDSQRPLPEYSLNRMLLRTGNPGGDMPSKVYKVSIRFTGFGEVRLGEAREAGPSTGTLWPKGAVFRSGLVDLNAVRMARIKDAPNVLVIAWPEEPDARGTSTTSQHGVAVVLLKPGAATVLTRRRYACSIRTTDYQRGWPLTYAHFSWDAEGGQLIERITIDRVVAGAGPGPLRRPAVLDEAGTKGFRAPIHETVTIAHAVVDGKLVPRNASLTYEARGGIDLAEVAAFYLFGESRHGEPEDKPFGDAAAAVQALLGANPDMAAGFERADVGDPMTLADGAKVRIPLPEKKLIARYVK